MIDGSVKLPTSGTICVGFTVDRPDILNNVKIYRESQEKNKYIADTSTYSKTLSGDWMKSTNTNSIVCVFYYSKNNVPKKDTVKDNTSKDDSSKNDSSKDNTTKGDSSKNDSSKDNTTKNDTPKDDGSKDTINTPSKTGSPLRVVIASDLHFDSITKGLTMGLTNDRFQVMVDSINAEHHKKPIDFVLLNGDLITLHSGNLANKKERLLELKRKYLDQLEMPYYAIRGNHDGFTDEEWEEVFHQKPQIALETDDYVFLMIDVYNTYDPSYFGGADMRYIGAYTQLDWIKKQVEHAKSVNKKVICVYHYINFDAAGEKEWLDYFKNEDAIIAHVVGHSHVVYNQKGSVTGKPKIGTGNFGNTSGQASDETHPKANRSGYKVIEATSDQLVAYHIYPALVYPSWDGEEYAPDETQTKNFKIIDLNK